MNYSTPPPAIQPKKATLWKELFGITEDKTELYRFFGTRLLTMKWIKER